VPSAAATDFSAACVPLRSVIASAMAPGRESTTRTARAVRTRPSGSTTAARSGETPRLDVSETPRTTAAGTPRARAHYTIGSDSMSQASAPVSIQSRAFSSAVETTVSTVRSAPARRRPGSVAVA
jgi:hypothetical protein